MSEQRVSDESLEYLASISTGIPFQGEPEDVIALALDLLAARAEIGELRIENAQICEKLAASQRGEDIPGLAQRAAKAETKLSAAGGLIVAAMNFVGAEHAVFGGPSAESCGLAAHDVLLRAARSYDAARVLDAKEPKP